MQKRLAIANIAQNATVCLCGEHPTLRKGKNPAILLNDGELIEQLNLRTERAVLMGVYPNNRLSEYTPWPEPAIRPGAPDFGGRLGQYHRELNNEILPTLIDEYALDTVSGKQMPLLQYFPSVGRSGIRVLPIS